MNQKAGPDPVKILVCDAQLLFAEALAAALDKTPGFEIGPDKPSSLAGALEAAAGEVPDVLLVDFWMEGVQDETMIDMFFTLIPPERVIFLSWLLNAEHIRRASSLGAAGILPKSLTIAQVAEAIKRVVEGAVPIYCEELSKLMEIVEQRSQKADQLTQQLAHLTPREMQILAHLSYGGPLAETAKSLGITPWTLKTHIRKILIKTGAQSQKEAIAMARYCGLIGG